MRANSALGGAESGEAAAPALEWTSSLHRMAMGQFEEALPLADISAAVAERLRHPERAVMVSVPTRMDDGSVGVFAGYRVQHSTVLGPSKGGIRYDGGVSLGDCAALAVWMTWKCALLRLPFGGAKGGGALRPALAVGERARAYDAPFHNGACEGYRARA